MSQTYEQLVSGSTTFGQFYGKINNLVEALRSAFSGTAYPSSPAPTAGQLCWRTDQSKLYMYDGAAWQEVAIGSTGLGLEIINARGSKPSVDQRLDVSINEDGTLKASTSLNPSEWYKPSLTFTYVSTTSFTVNGDQTDIYVPTRRLKINLSGSTAYTEVVSASYSAPNTTVQVLDSVLSATLVDVEHSLFKPKSYSGAISAAMVLASRPVKSITGTYTATLNDEMILADATAGAITINLPSAAGIKGKKFVIKKADSTANVITVDANASEKIDGNLTDALSAFHDWIAVESDNSDWRKVAERYTTPSAIPSGTKMVFFQAAAPTGWTQDTSQNDRALRVVSGSGGGTGGTNGLSSANTGTHTLTIGEIPAHGHTVNDPGHVHAGATATAAPLPSSYFMGSAGSNIGSLNVGSSTTGITIATAGGGGSHAHPLALAYIDVIICTKN